MFKNRYKREVGSDILGIYFGIDEENRYSLFIKLKSIPKVNLESNILETNITRRSDNTWGFKVSLNNENYLGVFRILINDLVDVVKGEIVQLVAEKKIIQRYSEWQQLFDKKDKIQLSFLQIQGLMGELYFLISVLFPKYGIQKSIESWSGPLGGNKDFQFQDSWYEVKTKSINTDIIHISNQKQLISEFEGHLTVLNCEKTIKLSNNSVSLMTLHREILSKIDNIETKQLYFERIAQVDFIPSSYYEEIYLEFHEIYYYLVDQDFPSIPLLDYSIINIKYDLFLPNLKKYLVKDGSESERIQRRFSK